MKIRQVELRRPETSWSAVVRGAVLCGVEKSNMQGLTMASSFVRSYGIVINTLSSDIENVGEERYRNPLTGLTYAEGQMVWMLHKGDIILGNQVMSESKIFSVSFNGQQFGRRTSVIYSFEDDDRPHNFHTGQNGKHE
jgi:hypothetical protein